MPRAYIDSTRNVTTEIFYPEPFSPPGQRGHGSPPLSKKKKGGGASERITECTQSSDGNTHTHTHPEPSSSHVSHSSQHTLISAQRGVPDEPLNPPDQRRLVFQRRQPETHMKCCLTFRGKGGVCVYVCVCLCVCGCRLGDLGAERCVCLRGGRLSV